jgi:SNF2 family DNA or RNA helicase
MFKLRTRVVLNGVKFKRRVILDFRKTLQVISKLKLSSHKPRRTKALHYGPLKVLPNWERLLSLKELAPRKHHEVILSLISFVSSTLLTPRPRYKPTKTSLIVGDRLVM